MTNTTHNVFVLADGTIRFVYDDALLPLLNAGDRRDVKRAGTIESEQLGPAWNLQLYWRVRVGAESYLELTREAALIAERTLVEANIAVI